MNEWTDEIRWRDEGMNGWMSEWVGEWMSEQKNEQVEFEVDLFFVCLFFFLSGVQQWQLLTLCHRRSRRWSHRTETLRKFVTFLVCGKPFLERYAAAPLQFKNFWEGLRSSFASRSASRCSPHRTDLAFALHTRRLWGRTLNFKP